MSNVELPPSLTIEKPAANLASLVQNASMQRLTQTLIHQWQMRDRFAEVRKYGIRPLDRALFFGPPGNGKTMSAQFIANKLGCPLYRVKCEQLITSEFGGSEKNLAKLMDWLAAQPMAVVLWDECESIFPSRSRSDNQAASRAIISVMQIFWQRLDRWQSPQIFLLATNLPSAMDPALISRIDLQIEFGPPTAEQCLLVLEYWVEVFHAYQPDTWGPELEAKFRREEIPASFRELWQIISESVRAVIVSGGTHADAT